MKLSAQAEAG